jgi:hypothetical protein
MRNGSHLADMQYHSHATVAHKRGLRFIYDFRRTSIDAYVIDRGPNERNDIAAALLRSSTLTANLLDAGMRTVHDLARSGESDNEVVAAGLDNHGLQGEDRLALIGSPFYPDCAFPYYARIGQLLVVEQIPDADEFWGWP